MQGYWLQHSLAEPFLFPRSSVDLELSWRGVGHPGSSSALSYVEHAATLICSGVLQGELGQRGLWGCIIHRGSGVVTTLNCSFPGKCVYLRGGATAWLRLVLRGSQANDVTLQFPCYVCLLPPPSGRAF